MIKILFMIHDMGPGGAEKVLVNLLNSMDSDKFDITLISLFGGGVNEQFLKPTINYKTVFKRNIPGNSHWMKCLSPALWHKLIVKEKYDIEVSYLEGPSARVISGCQDKSTKKVCWIHVEQHDAETAAKAFLSFEESKKCYSKFDEFVCVSESVREDFTRIYPMLLNTRVLYNTNDTDQIIEKKEEAVEDSLFNDAEIKLCGMGKLMPIKGFDKLVRIHRSLIEEGYPVHTYILGDGPEREKIVSYIKEYELGNSVTLLGYQTNPYKYLSKCDVFVCSSIAEGFSTAATEALIVGVPVVTTPVAGMREMLGDNEYGIVSEMSEESLHEALKEIVSSDSCLKMYKERASVRGKDFSKEKTVNDVQDFFDELKNR